jgi:multiple sugar transport system ATP-binding protein
MASIGIAHVYKSYGQVQVIRDVSIDIADGEFVCLVGPSGCGKSTLLRMIAGLESITAGDVAIGGRVVNGLAPKDRDIAMVFQNYALYPHLSVAENMGFSLRLRGRPPAEMNAAVKRAADTLGVAELLDRLPGQLSGGQRQRVAMGRAIVRNPSAFLFDEPLSNLDAKLRAEMRVEIKALQARLGTTAVYVTHDQIEAMTMADRVVVLRAGVVEQIGRPLDLYDRPMSRFVAGFLGSPSMNFLTGALERGEAGAALRLSDSIRLSVPAPASVAGMAVLGIRPEHIRIDPAGHAAEVRAVEPTGADTHVIVSLAGQPLQMVVHDRVAARPGETLPITVDPGRLHWFSPETGVRLE